MMRHSAKAAEYPRGTAVPAASHAIAGTAVNLCKPVESDHELPY